MTNLFYTGSTKFNLQQTNIDNYACVGQRGRGKTSYWLLELCSRCVDELLTKPEKVTHRFIYLRRSEEQLKKAIAKGLLNGIWNIPNAAERMHGYTHESIAKGRLYVSNGEDTLMLGYLEDLNNVKGQAVEDCDCLLFDEFVEADRSKYKGGAGGINEPELLARLDETIFRRRHRYMIWLGNFDSPTNPYFEYFKIPYGAKKWSSKARRFFFEVDYSEDTKLDKETTSVGTLWANTEYSEYSNGNIALGSVDTDLICDKPQNAVHTYNINVCGSKLTIWYDRDNAVYFIHDNYNFDKTKPIYTVMSKDMQVNGQFIAYNSLFLQMFRTRFACGLVRFNNQKTASLFNLMINLTK